MQEASQGSDPSNEKKSKAPKPSRQIKDGETSAGKPIKSDGKVENKVSFLYIQVLRQ